MPQAELPKLREAAKKQLIATLDEVRAQRDDLARLNAELGTTFLFSTHDPVVIERARRVVELRDGQVHRARVDA